LIVAKEGENVEWLDVKKKVGEAAALLVPSRGTIGLGTGSTADAFIRAIGARHALEKLDIQCLATSQASENLAKSLDLPLIDPAKWDGRLTISFDGADILDRRGVLCKGRGGALLREKIVAKASLRYVILVDERKCHNIEKGSVLPLEVAPFGINATLHALRSLDQKPTLRLQENGKPFLSDNNHWVVDLILDGPILSPQRFDESLKEIPGVLETGLFWGIPFDAMIGFRDGKVLHNEFVTSS
jgi:ribose 5-phosphate isomerase A